MYSYATSDGARDRFKEPVRPTGWTYNVYVAP